MVRTRKGRQLKLISALTPSWLTSRSLFISAKANCCTAGAPLKCFLIKRKKYTGSIVTYQPPNQTLQRCLLHAVQKLLHRLDHGIFPVGEKMIGIGDYYLFR